MFLFLSLEVFGQCQLCPAVPFLPFQQHPGRGMSAEDSVGAQEGPWKGEQRGGAAVAGEEGSGAG